MNLKKLLLIIITTIIILLLLRKLAAKFQKPKFDNMGNRTDYTEADIKAAFQKCKTVYGAEYARNVERLFRKETAHFKSGQFKKTLSPGMEIAGGTTSTKTTFAFGWSSLKEFQAANTKYPKDNFYVAKMNENGTALSKTFVGFPNVEAAVMFVAWFIKNKRSGRFGKWYSMNETSALAYESSLSQITAKYV